MGVPVQVCISLSVPDLPVCAATLKQSHAIVLRCQRRDPGVVMAMVSTVIVRLKAKVGQENIASDCATRVKLVRDVVGTV